MLYEPGPSTTRSTPVLVGMIVAAALPVVVGSTAGVDTMVVATAADRPSLGALPPQAANVATPNTMNNNGIIRPPHEVHQRHRREASGKLLADRDHGDIWGSTPPVHMAHGESRGLTGRGRPSDHQLI